MSDLRVLSVGQCGYDHGRLSRFLRDTFATATDRVDTTDEAIDALRSGQYGVVLVNRVFDGDGASGLALIGAIKADAALAHLPTMLVSNYPEAQAEAVALGAVPGFGKADLGRPRAREALAPILASAPV